LHPSPSPAPVASGLKYEGFATYFEGFGNPYGGCGVPQSWTVDDAGRALPFVALNTFADITMTGMGLFSQGGNCGRWLRIVAEDNCASGTNDQWRACIINRGGKVTSGLQNYAPDAVSGTVLYGYIADSCGDANVWCRGDPGHIDLSQDSLQSFISRGLWGNRRVSWQFMSGPPPQFTMSGVSFGWAKDSFLPYYPALIVHRLSAGVSKVSVRDVCGKYIDAARNGALGQMWILPGIADFGGGKVTVRVLDATGKPYGTFSVSFPCAGTCGDPTQATSAKVES